MATYVIGDVQGCYVAFCALIKKIQFHPQHDRIWLTGDLVCRGPDSLSTIKWIYDHQDSLVTVLGNHDFYLLRLFYTQRAAKEEDKLDKLLKDPYCEAFCNWLRKQKLIHVENNFVLVHAGIPIQWKLKDALEYSQETEQAIQDVACGQILNDLFGDEPNCWNNELNGIERLRVIVNYLTRMRYCTKEGRLEFTSKTRAQIDPQYRPWFDFYLPRSLNTTILFGHWAALQGSTGREDIVCMDYGCVWGGQLGAMRLEDGKLFLVDSFQ